MASDDREGLLTFDKVVLAAFLRGQGLTHDEVARKVGIRNKNVLVTMLKAAGLPEVAMPGMREVRVLLSNARYADAAAMTRQAGFDLERGLSEFVSAAARDRTIRDVLQRLK